MLKEITEKLVKHKLIKLKVNNVNIDNVVFRFHYRITTMILLLGVGLVSLQEYFGNNIRCLFADNDKDLVKVIERFCFFMTTFTVAKHHNKSVLHREIAHPGVGPYVENDKEDIIKHAYYQWVPFMLSFQAVCFYLPHLIWKEIEKGKIKALVEGFKQIEMINSSVMRKSFDSVQFHFKNRFYINRSWALYLILCECLNLINLIFQIHITNAFLGYQFMQLGPKVYWDPKGDEFYPLDVVFPKVTKCSFQKFGSSGSIQYQDIMCVMVLNVVNEKIYIFLWFWFVILFTLSVLVLLWRLVSYLMRKSVPLNLYVFRTTALANINRYNLTVVMRNLSFGEWMFLRYLASNMDGRLFDELVTQMAAYYDGEGKHLEPEYPEDVKQPLVNQ